MANNVPPVAAAVAAPAIDPADAIRDVFATCKLTAAQVNGLLTVHSLTDLSDFQTMRPKDASKFVKIYNDTSSARNIANKIGLPAVKRIEGLFYWYHDLSKRGITPNPDDFDAATLSRAIDAYAADEAGKDITETDIDPGKIETDLKWWNWKDEFINMSKQIKGVDGEPLYYVIRPDHDDAWEAPNELESRAEQLPLNGVVYERDSALLWAKLVKATNGTVAHEWLKDFEANKDARGAWKCLLLKCEGKDATNKRVLKATRITSLSSNEGGLFYSNEYHYSFTKYSTQLQEAYRVLKHNNNEVPAAMKVRRMMDGVTVQGNHIEIALAKDFISNNLLDDWDAAVSHMSTKLAIVFPPKSGSGKRKDFSGRRISETTRGRGRGRFGGRGRGGAREGGRGRGRGNERHDPRNGWFYGVNLNNADRRLSKECYQKIGPEGRQFLYDARQKLGNDDRHVEESTSNKGKGEDPDAEKGNATDKNVKSEKGGQAGTGFGRGAYNKKN